MSETMMFNPNVPDTWDFQARQRALADRKSLLAAQMLKGNQMPQGQMVGDHYVAPHWSQQLAPMLNQFAAIKGQKDLTAEQTAFDQADRQAALLHQQSRPQSTPGGEMAADGFGPPTPAFTPTSQDQLNWAQQGMAIPSRRETMERLINDLEVNEPVRQENRQFKTQEREDNLTFKREQLQQQLTLAEAQAENTRLSIEQRATAAEEARKLQAQLSADRLAFQRESAADRRMLIQAQVDKAQAGKPLPQSAIKDLGGMEDNANAIARLQSEFKPEFAGIKGAVSTAAADYLPNVETDAGNFWKNYRKESALTERHALFGASLTTGEQNAWKSADISPSMSPDAIQKNLARRAELSNKVYNAALARQQGAGYNVGDAFQPRPVAPSAGGGEQTKTIGGVTYVKRGSQWFAQ